MEALLDRVQQKTKMTAVAISRVPKVAGHLCKPDKPFNRDYVVVTFERIRNCLRIAKHDRFFVLGGLTLERKCGWPMGGSLSEPGTLIDLQEDIRLCFNSQSYSEQCGWHLKEHNLQHIPFEQLVTAVQHVDDAFPVTKIFCDKCIETRLGKTWPKDVGISVEEKGRTIRFLSSWVHFNGHDFIVLPHNPNIQFAMGVAAAQKVSRLGTYLGEGISQFRHFHMFFMGRLLTYHHITSGNINEVEIHVWILMYEVYRLSWPFAFIWKSVQKIPRRHQSDFLTYCRNLGKRMRRANSLEEVITAADFNRFATHYTSAQEIFKISQVPVPVRENFWRTCNMGGPGKGWGKSSSTWVPQWTRNAYQGFNRWTGRNQNVAQQPPVIIAGQAPTSPQVIVVPQPAPTPTTMPGTAYHGMPVAPQSGLANYGMTTAPHIPLYGNQTATVPDMSGMMMASGISTPSIYPPTQAPNMISHLTSQAGAPPTMSPTVLGPGMTSMTPHLDQQQQLILAEQQLRQQQQQLQQLQQQQAAATAPSTASTLQKRLDDMSSENEFIALRASKAVWRRLLRRGSNETASSSSGQNTNHPDSISSGNVVANANDIFEEAEKTLVGEKRTIDDHAQQSEIKKLKADAMAMQQMITKQSDLIQKQQHMLVANQTRSSSSTSASGRPESLPGGVVLPMLPVLSGTKDEQIKSIPLAIWETIKEQAILEPESMAFTAENYQELLYKCMSSQDYTTLCGKWGIEVSGNKTRKWMLGQLYQKMKERIERQ